MITHPTSTLISRYADGADDVDDATVWAVEAHLENCATCRARLAESIDPGTRDLLDRAAAQIATGIVGGPGPAPRRTLWRTRVVARFLPWVATAVALMLLAVAFEQSFASVPSLVLLVAPLAPLPAVAAVWSRHTDPAWELMATVPRTRLWLLLRRTLGVLAAVLPVLAVAGFQTGHAPALWLLPCLAFTAGSLVLGGLVGVDRAALALGVVWSAAVVAPSLATTRLPAILQSGSWPGWAVLTVVLLVVAIALPTDYRRLGGIRS